MRPKGEVPFPDNTWLKRYHEDKKWHSIRESDAISIIQKEYYPEDWDRMMHNAREGGMALSTEHFDLMFIKDSAYQDELS